MASCFQHINECLYVVKSQLRSHWAYYKGVLWSPSYFASSCGGAPIDVIRRYIEQQQTPH